MEFRLTYQGRLPSDNLSTSDKHLAKMAKIKGEIRSVFHPQIKSFWLSHPATQFPGSCYQSFFTEQHIPFWQYYSEKYKQMSESGHVYRFAPLVTEKTYNGCSLNVLFLRRDTPRTSLLHQGDLDNRMKVLFDALRMPTATQELCDTPQAADEVPCFCLLSDDKYIDHVAVTTDRWLSPRSPNESEENVLVVVHATVNIMMEERYFQPM